MPLVAETPRQPPPRFPSRKCALAHVWTAVGAGTRCARRPLDSRPERRRRVPALAHVQSGLVRLPCEACVLGVADRDRRPRATPVLPRTVPSTSPGAGSTIIDAVRPAARR